MSLRNGNYGVGASLCAPGQCYVPLQQRYVVTAGLHVFSGGRGGIDDSLRWRVTLHVLHARLRVEIEWEICLSLPSKSMAEIAPLVNLSRQRSGHSLK